MAPREFLKDPDAKLDYKFNWKNWLTAGETIASYVLTVSGGGLTIDTHSDNGVAVTVWLKAGVNGTERSVSCRITTTAGRIDERTMRFTIQER